MGEEHIPNILHWAREISLNVLPSFSFMYMLVGLLGPCWSFYRELSPILLKCWRQWAPYNPCCCKNTAIIIHNYTIQYAIILKNYYITHAGGCWCVGRVTCCVCDCLCMCVWSGFARRYDSLDFLVITRVQSVQRKKISLLTFHCFKTASNISDNPTDIIQHYKLSVRLIQHY